MAKMGRPLKTEQPLNVDIKVRIDEATHERLIAYAQKRGLKKVDVIRQGIALVLTEEE